jgi:hypothetical protein
MSAALKNKRPPCNNTIPFTSRLDDRLRLPEKTYP